MEGHKDDNDILPQMEELGQALEISQLHISLEKISTFLEEKIMEGSDN